MAEIVNGKARTALHKSRTSAKWLCKNEGKKVFPMSCFGATISSALILSKNEEKYEEWRKKFNIFFSSLFHVRAQLRNFYLEMHQGSTFIGDEAREGEVFPRDVTTSLV